MENDKQGGDPKKKPSGGALKQMERNACGVSLTPAELHQRQLDYLGIGPILQWVGSGIRTFGPEVYATSAATRHYWNTWNLLQVENGVLMRCFMKHDATGDHLQLLVPKAMHAKVLQHVHNSMLWGHLGQKK